MKLFGASKKTDKDEAVDDSIKIMTIPTAFYGGSNPVIYEGEGGDASGSEKASSKITVDPKLPIIPPPKNPESAQPMPTIMPHEEKSPVQMSGTENDVDNEDVSSVKSDSKKTFLIAGVIAVFLALVGTGAFVFLRILPESRQNLAAVDGGVGMVIETPPIVDVPPIVEEPMVIVPPVEIPSSTVTSTDFGQEPVFVPTLRFPRARLPLGFDSDNDGLTDSEETLLGLDSSSIDTDADGYPDALELANLYDPGGFTPRRLIDSGRFSEYINAMGWRMYYPSSFSVGEVDLSARHLIFSGASGDFFEVRLIDKQSGEDFSGWFNRMAVGENFAELQTDTNLFGIEMLRRQDGLVAYLPDFSSEYVMVLIYQPGVAESISYKKLFEVMLDSLRLGATARDLPVQSAIPLSTN